MRKTPLSIIIIILFTNCIFGQTTIVSELNKSIIPIETMSPDSSFDDINSLLTLIKEKKIIGLGEATHGTHEFFVYKHRLIKLLAEKADFKIFIIEADFAGSQEMNDYILYGKGNPSDGLFKMGMGVWMTNEFIQMIEWMKEYNLKRPLCEKLKFYGCDMQYAQASTNMIKAYLLKKGRLNSKIENGLNWFINKKYAKKYPLSELKAAQETIYELHGIFQSINDTTNKEFLFNTHIIRELEQHLEFISNTGDEHYLLRDKFMAENIEWVYNFENKENTVLWAHNGHVNKNGDNTNKLPFGYYLKNKFGEKYYSLGFGLYQGILRDFNQQTRKWELFDIAPPSFKNSSDKIFSQCASPNFILDFKSIAENERLKDFLDTKFYMRSIGAGYNPNNDNKEYQYGKLYDSFDAIIYFKETGPTEEIKKNNE